MGRPELCLSLAQARTPDIVLVAKAAGFDAVYVDLEHGVTPLDVTSMLCTTALGVGVTPYVRVPSLDPPLITRVLDGGAVGVIVPHIDTAAQARALVDVCRFPPVGARTLYGLTPTTGYRPAPVDELTEELDGRVVVVPMLESAAACGRAGEIAAVPGVDILLVGAHDLSADLGVPGQVGHDAVRDAMTEVAKACATNGRRFGVAGIGDPGQLRELRSHGLDFVSAGSDVGLLASAAAGRVAELRTLFDPDKDGSR